MSVLLSDPAATGSCTAGKMTVAASDHIGSPTVSCLSVSGLPPAVAANANGRGVGLRNTRERLKVLYGGAHSVEVADASPGLRVEMRLPLEI